MKASFSLRSNIAEILKHPFDTDLKLLRLSVSICSHYYIIITEKEKTKFIVNEDVKADLKLHPFKYMYQFNTGQCVLL